VRVDVHNEIAEVNENNNLVQSAPQTITGAPTQWYLEFGPQLVDAALDTTTAEFTAMTGGSAQICITPSDLSGSRFQIMVWSFQKDSLVIDNASTLSLSLANTTMFRNWIIPQLRGGSINIPPIPWVPFVVYTHAVVLIPSTLQVIPVAGVLENRFKL
jgi:hypothetical protein